MELLLVGLHSRPCRVARGSKLGPSSISTPTLWTLLSGAREEEEQKLHPIVGSFWAAGCLLWLDVIQAIFLKGRRGGSTPALH